jgi:hypothetical protein
VHLKAGERERRGKEVLAGLFCSTMEATRRKEETTAKQPYHLNRYIFKVKSWYN